MVANEKPNIATGMVGARGFEPPTFCSQSRRTTRLCNAPCREDGLYYTINSVVARDCPAKSLDFGVRVLVVEHLLLLAATAAALLAANLLGGLTRG